MGALGSNAFRNIAVQEKADLTGCAVRGGTFSESTLDSPTLNTPTLNTPTLTSPAVSDASESGTHQYTGGDASGVVVQRIGATATEGLERVVIDETVVLTNAAQVAITSTIPGGALLVAVQSKLLTAITGDGSGDDGLVKVGIGDASDPDRYGKTADLAQNAGTDFLQAPTAAADAQITINAVDTNGTAVTEKFTAGGQVRVRVIYDVLNSLDNAA